MGQRARIGNNPASGYRTIAQRPQKAFVPVLLLTRLLHLGQRFGDSTVGGINRRIYRIATLVLEAIFLVPNILGGSLKSDFDGVGLICSFKRFY